MPLSQELALMRIFAETVAAKQRELRFYQASEHELDRRTLQERREKAREFAESIMASDEQMAVFRHQLDRYDTAVVDALTDNEHRLEENRRRREDMDAKAYHLPDGRPVYKSDDGLHVVDRNGDALPNDLIDPQSVPDALPRWGQREALNQEEQRLIQDRERLHEYQGKLDKARDTIDKGGVTAKQLDDLDADLKASMPDAVRQRVVPNGLVEGPEPSTGPFENLKRGPGPLELNMR